MSACVHAYPNLESILNFVCPYLPVLCLRLEGARGVTSRTYTAVLSPATTALIVSSSQVDCMRYVGAS